MLAGRAFATPEDRAWLEGVLWPRVGARMAAWRDSLGSLEPKPRAAVVEVPLLFESGMGNAFDATISVLADEAVRSERAEARGHQALDERARRSSRRQEKAQRATFVVVNDGTVEELERSCGSVLDKLGR